MARFLLLFFFFLALCVPYFEQEARIQRILFQQLCLEKKGEFGSTSQAFLDAFAEAHAQNKAAQEAVEAKERQEKAAEERRKQTEEVWIMGPNEREEVGIMGYNMSLWRVGAQTPPPAARADNR
jgi:hypothetical protein